MIREKLRDYALIILGILAGGYLLIFLLKSILPVFSPFIIAWAVALAVRGPARRLSEKTRVPESVLRVFISIFVTLIAFGGVTLLIWQISAALWRFLSGIDESSPIFIFLESLSGDKLPFFSDLFPEGLGETLSEALNAFIGKIISNLGETLTSWVSVVPSALFFTLITVISLIYFSLDLERVNRTVKKFIPQRVISWLSRFKREAFSAFGKYAKSYLIILLITFAVMLCGLVVLGVENAVIIALIIALLDILPVIGVGTVLIPWSIFAFAAGNIGQGIGLIVIFIVNTVIRQLAEPKILGKNLNLHPILTLVSMYVGFAFFGFFGLFTAPLIAVIPALFKNNSTPQVDKTAPEE